MGGVDWMSRSLGALGAKPGWREQKDRNRDKWEGRQEDPDSQEMQTESEGERKGEEC